MNIHSIAVVGAGQMGSGIAQTAAGSGFTVLLYDIDQPSVQRGITRIRTGLSRLVQKGSMTEERLESIVQQLATTSNLDDLGGADIVIEAAPEQKETKKELFRSLDRICRPEAILATNTSSISITDIASAASRPERVIGMHFMNPVPVMPLVEVIRGLATSDEVLGDVMELARAFGKSPVEVRDMPGFVSNRVLMPMINEAIYTVYEGVASPEAVDQVMKLGMNHPMGPLTLADFIGLDTCLAIMETLYDGFGDSKYRPCPLLRNYVAAGWLGKKTGRGFYRY